LLVEDDQLVRQIARRILQSHGYTVLEARNGNEALQILKQQRGPIDLMLTDLVMPGLNGRELASRLTSRYPEMKVLFMSGYVDNGVMDKNMAGPGLVYIQKPFEAHALARKVRELLDSSSLQGPPAVTPPKLP
jgi:two-component system cell cycle sensor histidine kinase/response regulator CckA